MTESKLDRRQMLKLEAAAMAAVAGGMPVPALAANLVTEREASELKWDKAPCRFCGTGCGVLVGDQGRPRGRHPGRPGRAGQPRPQLHQGLLPVQDHVRQGPADHSRCCA